MNSVIKVDTNKIPWIDLVIPELGAVIKSKPCIIDDDTGMSVAKVCYPAGFTNVSHTHNCAHGMFVLDGILITSEGNFGPGEFVWFPEGQVMTHGAQTDNDVTFLFITNKPFDVNYVHTIVHLVF